MACADSGWCGRFVTGHSCKIINLGKARTPRLPIRAFHESERCWMKRRMILLIFLLCIQSVLPIAFSENQFYSISEIRNQTPERWIQTYQAKGRTVEVDVPIYVPSASVFPIIRITAAEPVHKALLSDYRRIMRNGNGTFDGSSYPTDQVIQQNWRCKTQIDYPGNAVAVETPENCALDYPRALSFANGEISRLFHLETDACWHWKTTVSSCFYRYSKSKDGIIWHERKTESGQYKFFYRPLFHDIPYQATLDCFEDWSLKNEKLIRDSRITFSLSSLETYKVTAFLYREKDVVFDDVPLLGFDAAKIAFEKMINAGQLRSVDSVELCYVPYLDSKDEKILWLLPAWYVRGGYCADPTREFQPEQDEVTGEILDDGIERHDIVFQAQLGTLLDYKNHKSNRRIVPQIITWHNR